MSNVVEIGKGKFQRRNQDYCPHEHLLYDPSEESVECADCGRSIGAFAAFTLLVRNIDQEKNRRQYMIDELRELEKKNLVLKAAKHVEKAWRRRSMVPICPHCSEAIFPEDGLGNRMTNKKRAIESRKFKT